MSFGVDASSDTEERAEVEAFTIVIAGSSPQAHSEGSQRAAETPIARLAKADPAEQKHLE